MKIGARSVDWNVWEWVQTSKQGMDPLEASNSSENNDGQSMRILAWSWFQQLSNGAHCEAIRAVCTINAGPGVRA